ncbi:hypothetical protein [Arenibaculum sp.]|jgi:hypothetical protein|uniref:hypothetical protein n=1 Tax=Arenibaculum sp. TaxID=2865862 RepID=UPI002E12DABD|nr:hypothetical protein [Arenibaculum sp.]
MDRNHLFVALVLVCIANGVFSPALIVATHLWPVWFPAMIVQPSAELVFYLGSLIVSGGTMLVSGVPAALYERMTGREDTTPLSLTIWLAGAILLSIPGLLNAMLVA